MRTEAVLFDYGMTLVAFEYPAAALLEVMESVRPWLGDDPPTAEWLLFHVLHPLETDLDTLCGEREVAYMDFYAKAWQRAGLDLDPDVLLRILDLEQQCWDRAVTIAPGAFELLDRIRARGIRTGICSNAPFPVEMMRRQVAAIGLLERMDAVVFSSAVGWRKPAPELYRAALTELRATAERTLFVGDKVKEDYLGPQSIGMRAVIFTGLSGRPAPEDLPTIASLGELESLL